MRLTVAWIWMLLPWLLVPAGCAHADWQTRSWSQWQLGTHGAEAVVGIDAAELQRLGVAEPATWWLAAVRRDVRLAADEVGCVAGEATLLPAAASVLRVRLRFDCPAGAPPRRVAVHLFLDAGLSPLHYARFERDGKPAGAVMLTRAEPQAELPQAQAAAAVPGTVARYLGLGFHHILDGLDHIAFLCCLLLASARRRDLVWMVTGFTLGHSITLALSALDLVRVSVAGVEALIGFTVLLLAAEVFARAQRSLRALLPVCVVVLLPVAFAVAGRPVALPPSSLLALLLLAPGYLLLALRLGEARALHLGMSALFGLVHGFGFASVLKALGLPDGQAGWALAGFNLGVELGQLLLLALIGAALAAAHSVGGARAASDGRRLAASMLCAIGVFWFIGRSIV